MRFVRVLAYLLAFIAPASAAAMAVAHGVAHEHQLDSHIIGHTLAQTVHGATTGLQHESLHGTSSRARLVPFDSDYALPSLATALPTPAMACAEYPVDVNVSLPNPVHCTAQARAPPAT